ncbi:MAG TPA: hypothetical protein VMD30_01255 [Tepidisphaeraceae bacterium]|nr:hypothetical protein [Tepidisphaeraceae bacterium]
MTSISRPLVRNEVPAIPLLLKFAYTAFMGVLIPTYLHTYGPREFLWFCDIGLLLALPALWLENSLLASTSAVGVLIAQAIWIADFFGHPIGLRIFGAAGYMFDPTYTHLIRGISLFHIWFPILILWTVHRLGYDRRAFALQTIICIVTLMICRICFIPPNPAIHCNLAVNENCVFGLGASAWRPVSETVWLMCLTVGMPMVFYWPTHKILGWAFPAHRE